MADQQRTLADLQALLADNASNDISPQDIRDFLVSSLGGFGGIGFTVETNTGQALTTTPVAITGWDVDMPADGFAVTPKASANNVSVDLDGIYLVQCAFSISTDGNEDLVFSVRKNGVIIPGGLGRVDQDGAGDDTNNSLFAIDTFVATDIVELFMAVGNGAATIDNFAGQIIVTRMQ